MSDVLFDEVLALALKLPRDEQVRLAQELLDEDERADVQVRLRKFEAAARVIGEEAERLGYDEDNAAMMIRAVRRRRTTEAQ
jgi:hypothetical protein